MNSLAFTTRTVGDAEGRRLASARWSAAGAARAHGTATTTCTRRIDGTWMIQPPDAARAAATAAALRIRFRDRPELRVDSTRLIDTGPIDADDA